MIYLDTKNVKKIGIRWDETIGIIEETVSCMYKKEYVQPIKPYLRYRDLQNRIIAMPAFVGDKTNTSGIKWVTSFPNNILKNIPRAHSVLILNNADTGEPLSIINSALLSIIRTVSVSGFILKHFYKSRRVISKSKLGIIGWGPIGQYHLKMIMDLFGSKISQIFLYDIRPIIRKEDIFIKYRDKVVITQNWNDVYNSSDVFLTSTVSKKPYINIPPKNGSLILNISLRDFRPEIFDYVNGGIIIDDWNEVCRENTDIENFANEKGLKKENTYSIVDVLFNNIFEKIAPNQTIMFNPMGMAIFDIAIGKYYYDNAIKMKVGNFL